jgi:hypothetical protein
MLSCRHRLRLVHMDSHCQSSRRCCYSGNPAWKRRSEQVPDVVWERGIAGGVCGGLFGFISQESAKFRLGHYSGATKVSPDDSIVTAVNSQNVELNVEDTAEIVLPSRTGDGPAKVLKIHFNSSSKSRFQKVRSSVQRFVAGSICLQPLAGSMGFRSSVFSGEDSPEALQRVSK